MYAFHASAHQTLSLLLQSLGYIAYAAHSGQNPQLVAHAHAAVLPGIAQKGFGRQRGETALLGLIRVAELAAEQGAQVVYVYMAAPGNERGRLTDGGAVLDDFVPGRQVLQSYLVSGRNRGLQGEGFAVNGKAFSLFQRAQGHRYIICRIDF